MADAHDLYARILADKGDYERAFDEWDMALRIAPGHTGALKGLSFLYFKVGDVDQAVAHLESARRHSPDDPGIEQALAVVRGGRPVKPAAAPAAGRQEPAATAAAAMPLEDARVFAGLEGAQEGLLLLDAAGRVLGGALRNPAGDDVTDAVAAYLAGVSREAARTAKLLGLGTWTGLATEGGQGHVHLAPAHVRRPAAGAARPRDADRTPRHRGAAGRARGTSLAGAAGMTAAPFERALDRISRVRGVRGSMFVSADDGLVVAELLMEGVNGGGRRARRLPRHRLGRAMEAAGIGRSVFWHLQGTDGTLLVVPAAPGSSWSRSPNRDVNVGLCGSRCCAPRRRWR